MIIRFLSMIEVMNTFDIVLIIIFGIAFFIGLNRGLLRSAMGPCALSLWAIIGIVNYDLNGNVIKSIFIIVAGTLITTLAIGILFYLGKKNIQDRHRYYVFIGSRIAGAILNLLWYGFFVTIIASIIMLLPNNSFGLQSMQSSIARSASYPKIYTYFVRSFPIIEKAFLAIAVFKNPEKCERYKETHQYQALFSDPRIKYITENPDILSKFYSKDAFSLLQDPHIREILQDDAVMLKVSKLAEIIFSDIKKTQ